MKLNELAIVKTGLVTARKQARKPSDGTLKYRLLNLRAINANGYIEEKYIEDFRAMEKLKAEYLTHTGDIVVRLTVPYTAVMVTDDYSGLVIPSHFVVIRPYREMLLPEYLYWLLNTDKVKGILQQNVSSMMIGTVKPKVYADLEIDVLSLEEQRKIADLNQMARRELHLLRQLMGRKELYYKAVIDKIQKGMEENANEKNDKK